MQQKSAYQRRINVRAIGFDGSVFNTGYIQSKDGPGFNTSPNRLIEENEGFLTHISQEIQQGNYDQVYFSVNSGRQSYGVDTYNASGRQTGSCFSALENLTKEVKRRTGAENIEVEPYLVADSANNLRSGTSFYLAQYPSTETNHATYEIKNFRSYDEIRSVLRRSALLGQIHKIASENPDSEIIFDVSDSDRALLEQFKQLNDERGERSWIPENVTLRLHYYAGEAITFIGEYKGTGPINPDYSATINNFLDGNLVSQGEEHHFANARSRQDLLQAWPSSLYARYHEAVVLMKNRTIHAKQENSYPSIISALEALDEVLPKAHEYPNDLSPEQKASSKSNKIRRATVEMLENLLRLPKHAPKEVKLAVIQAYERKCELDLASPVYVRAVGTVILAVVGLVIGAAAGYGIGMLLGADWSNPIDAILNTVDLFKGSVTREAIAFLTSTLVGGVGVGAIAGFLFFKPDQLTPAANTVARTARELVEGEASSVTAQPQTIN